jgi:hypothetical protein
MLLKSRVAWIALTLVVNADNIVGSEPIRGGLDLFAYGVSLRTLRYFARRLRKSGGRSSEHSIELTPESLAGIIADYLLAVGDHAFASRVLDRLRRMFGMSPATEGQSP